MDTRFWGPSGWRILHLIASSPFAAAKREFWETLPQILPCKFCRTSLSTQYEEYPVPFKQDEFAEWLYNIHNCVNDKLRKQGQNVPPDPPFSAVEQTQKELLAQGCTKTSFPGWNFLFCIADNHPAHAPSKPMPDVPKPAPTSLKERNKQNLLTVQERKAALRRFWLALPAVLPFPEWQKLWRASAGTLNKAVISRRSALSWLWKIHCRFESELSDISNKNFWGLCKQIATHRSGCSTSLRAKTCRAQKGGSRKTRKQQQR